MTLLFRCSLLLAMGLWVGPVWAQNSDAGGSLPQSDVSGTLTQSDVGFFQSDEARIRMADIASALTAALREGTLGPSITGTARSLAVPDLARDLLLTSSHAETSAFVDLLVAEGIPAADATVLARSVSGLLEGNSLSPTAVRTALHAFNRVVDRAPASFLADPPQEVVVVRLVLVTLLAGAAS